MSRRAIGKPTDGEPSPTRLEERQASRSSRGPRGSAHGPSDGSRHGARTTPQQPGARRFRPRTGTLVAALLGGSLLLEGGLARGTQVEQAAAAEALFDEGLALLDAGELERACAKLRASQELDPGVGTLMYLAECHRRLGQYASAWTRFLEGAALARATQQPERAALAQAHADELAPALSRLTVKVSPQAVRAGVQIRRGGLLLRPDTWGSALPVDPGSYVILATAPGHQPFRQTAHVGQNGDQVVVLVPPLLPQRPEAAPGADPAAVGASRPDDHEPARSRTLRPITWALGGLTLAGAAVGTTFAVWAEDIEARTLKGCEPGPKCGPTGLDELDRAQRRANVAYASFAIAGASIVTATVWEIHARRSSLSSQRRKASWGLAVSPAGSSLEPRGVRVTLQGGFE